MVINTLNHHLIGNPQLGAKNATGIEV
jgi:hypothetical protein